MTLPRDTLLFPCGHATHPQWRLAAARVVLFGARDVWFVVGVPVFLYAQGWTFTMVGTFLAAWTIAYGVVQALAPQVVRRSSDGLSSEVPAARWWSAVLALVPIGLAVAVALDAPGLEWVVVAGLGLFGLAFAVNSSVHSYLVLAYAGSLGEEERVLMNPGRNPKIDRPAGGADPRLSFLVARTPEGRPLALLANYGLHYVGGVPGGEISADYFAVFARKIGERLGVDPLHDPPFVGIMSNGTSGDVNNIDVAGQPPARPHAPYERMTLVAEL